MVARSDSENKFALKNEPETGRGVECCVEALSKINELLPVVFHSTTLGATQNHQLAHHVPPSQPSVAYSHNEFCPQTSPVGLSTNSGFRRVVLNFRDGDVGNLWMFSRGSFVGPALLCFLCRVGRTRVPSQIPVPHRKQHVSKQPDPFSSKLQKHKKSTTHFRSSFDPLAPAVGPVR